MCIKKNEQNGTNTRIHPMRHKIERQTEKKTEDVVEIEIQIDCTSTGLFQKTNKNVRLMFLSFFRLHMLLFRW
jgi:hypothetical protein